MKMAGCGRSISYSAVVPHLAWPTMKKSGTAPTSPPRRSARSSLDVLIAPACHEVLPEVLAERDYLGLVARAQLRHQRLVERLGRAVQKPFVDRLDEPAPRLRR